MDRIDLAGYFYAGVRGGPVHVASGYLRENETNLKARMPFLILAHELQV